MQYLLSPLITDGKGHVALDANVPKLVDAIRLNQVIPYGDYGSAAVYYFSVPSNSIGNIIFTVFDRATGLGLSSTMVRYGAASTVRQIISGTGPRSTIDLQYFTLPIIPPAQPPVGQVIP